MLWPASHFSMSDLLWYITQCFGLILPLITSKVQGKDYPPCCYPLYHKHFQTMNLCLNKLLHTQCCLCLQPQANYQLWHCQQPLHLFGEPIHPVFLVWYFLYQLTVVWSYQLISLSQEFAYPVKSEWTGFEKVLPCLQLQIFYCSNFSLPLVMNEVPESSQNALYGYVEACSK